MVQLFRRHHEWAALMALILTGCVFSPNLGDGQIRCASDGTCPPGQSCGGDNFCRRSSDSPVDAGSCVPLHCYVGWCGPVDDGCGHMIDCGSCNPGSGGGPVDMSGCVPSRSCVAGLSCGKIDDGCGHSLDCGDCTDKRACSNTMPNQCTCTPKTCASVGATCGAYPSGCNQVELNCFANPDMGCASGVCGGGGPYACGSTFTCNPLKKCPPNACGPIPDGCSGILHCGLCPSGHVCGGGGKPSSCD